MGKDTGCPACGAELDLQTLHTVVCTRCPWTSHQEKLTTTERKLLATVWKHPGMRWYEVGALTYPNSTVVRRNLWGEPFRDLVGSRAVSLSRSGLGSLEDRGLVRRDGAHRYYVVEA